LFYKVPTETTEDIEMKSLLIGLGLLSKTAFGSNLIIMHQDCRVKNNTLSIKNADGRLAWNSPESILREKGYSIGLSSNPNDAMEDLIQLNYSDFMPNNQITVELVVNYISGQDNIFIGTGTTVSDAVRALPMCRIYAY
jgi:hypothetical protein